MALGYFGSSNANPARIDAVTGAAPVNAVQASFMTPYGVNHPAVSPNGFTPPTLGEAIEDVIANLPPDNDYLKWTDGAGNPIGGGSGVSAAAPVSDGYDYYNAKLASIYKMSAETAYQEALANTSYQRAVEDLKAAGLNPVLAAGKVSGADSFFGRLDSGASGGAGGGFSGGRSYSGKSSGKGLLSSALKDYNVRQGISAVASGIVTAKTGGNFTAGAAAYYFSNAVLNAASKFF